MENFKKIHQLLFKEENIEKYSEVFRQLLKFWQDFNALGLDRNRSLNPAFESISRWGGFVEDLELLLNYQAPKDASNCSIYFIPSDGQESSKKVAQLKNQAFDGKPLLIQCSTTYWRSR